MPKVTYHPDKAAGCPDVTEQFGHSFTAGEPVEVDDAKALGKFAGHPFFKVDGFVPAADGLAAGGAGTVSGGTADALRAVHNGGGRFIIVRGDKDQKVKEGLNKADADAFNALSDEDKEAYVA